MNLFSKFMIWFGETGLFFKEFVKHLVLSKFEWRQFWFQLDEVGSRSLVLVGISGLAIGVVLAMQFLSTLAKFGAESMLPSMISLSVIREIGPIITALVVSGRVAAGIGAELGSMRVTEQIDAIDVSAVNSYNYLVVPRIVACIVALPLLTIYCDIIAITGGYIGTIIERPVTLQYYISSVIRYLGPEDIFPGVLKTTVFGFIIGFIGCFKGYTTTGGTAGVGLSATNAVVMASLIVIVAEVVLVKISILFF